MRIVMTLPRLPNQTITISMLDRFRITPSGHPAFTPTLSIRCPIVDPFVSLSSALEIVLEIVHRVDSSLVAEFQNLTLW